MLENNNLFAFDKGTKKKFTEYLNINRSRTGLHNTRSSYICNLSRGLQKQCTRQARVGLSHFTKVTKCSLGVPLHQALSNSINCHV